MMTSTQLANLLLYFDEKAGLEPGRPAALVPDEDDDEELHAGGPVIAVRSNKSAAD